MTVDHWSICMLAVCGALVTSDIPAAERDEPEKAELPDEYVTEYPDAERCCAPIRSTFFEVTRTFGVVKGKRFRQKTNGGYGLPVIDKVDGKNLLHVGADLGWYQVGEPVFAIANGVVRVSTGPVFSRDRDATPVRESDLVWGNFVVIEHRFGDDDYVTTLYGHLGTERHVQAGDVVRAGQMIGTIGRKHARINGGYEPHLHFGVRSGRIAEIGATLLQINVNGKQVPLKLAAFDEKQIEVSLAGTDIPRLSLRLAGEQFEIAMQAGKLKTSASLLWHVNRPDFALVGYSLSKEDWRDPVRFLREHHAHTAPAEYLPTRLSGAK